MKYYKNYTIQHLLMMIFVCTCLYHSFGRCLILLYVTSFTGIILTFFTTEEYLLILKLSKFPCCINILIFMNEISYTSTIVENHTTVLKKYKDCIKIYCDKARLRKPFIFPPQHVADIISLQQLLKTTVWHKLITFLLPWEKKTCCLACLRHVMWRSILLDIHFALIKQLIMEFSPGVQQPWHSYLMHRCSIMLHSYTKNKKAIKMSRMHKC
jgi:hypothetical protein